MTYFDYCANTPVDKEVLDTYIQSTVQDFANPNSFHQLGLNVKAKIDESTKNIANHLNVNPEEIIYTSGASESNNLAIKGLLNRYKNKGKHLLVGPLEHNSVMGPLTHLSREYEIEVLQLDKDGKIDIQDLKAKLREDTLLVTICAVDSELMIRQPIEEIANLLKDTKTYFHVDASQAIGKVNINYENVHLITLTPHKFYGMNGSGILIKKNKTSIKPLIDGGRSTTIYRAGTPVTAQILASEVAIEKAMTHIDERQSVIKKYQKDLLSFLSNYPMVHINNTKYSLENVINFSILQTNSAKMAAKFEEHQIYLSTKSSCCPENTPSKLVYALTKSKQLASSSIRLSLSHLTTDEDINRFKEAFTKIYKETFDE